MNIKRNTVQKQIILDVIKNSQTHPTVEDVYLEIQKAHPNISKATVYRNLHQLSESGEIQQILMPDYLERYDRNAGRHYHFQCRICENIYDINIDYLDTADKAVRQKYDFQIDSHDMIFKGICYKCRKADNI